MFGRMMYKDPALQAPKKPQLPPVAELEDKNIDLSTNIQNIQKQLGINKIAKLCEKCSLESKKSKYVFTFDLSESIEVQLSRFQVNLNQNLKAIQRKCDIVQFVGFKRGLKYEYWTIYEKELRLSEGVKEIRFIDSKLGKNHMEKLGDLLNWKGSQIILELNNNELEDIDLEDFMFGQLLAHSGHLITQLRIINNPGIYKGHFIKNLKTTLKGMNNGKSQLQLFKNKQNKSLAFLQYQNQHPPCDLEEQIRRIEIALNTSSCLKLTIPGAKFDSIDQTLEIAHLIKEIYREENYTQLEYLELENVKLKDGALLKEILTHINKSKGLLHFGMNLKDYMKDSEMARILQGDRYGRFRPNTFTIGLVDQINGKVLEVLANSFFASSIRFVQFGLSDPTNRQILGQLTTIQRAFQNEVNKLKCNMFVKAKEFPKLKIKSLCLKMMPFKDFYQDLFNMLNSIVFNEFSSCKELEVTQITQIMVQSLIDCVKYLESIKKNNPAPAYKGFKSSLKKIVFQDSPLTLIDLNVYENLFLNVLLTTNDNVTQIETLIFSRYSLLNARWKPIQMKLEAKLKDNPKLQLTIKNIIFQDNPFSFEYFPKKIISFLLFQPQAQLESLGLINLQVDKFNKEIIKGFDYLDQIPTGSFLALKKLTISFISVIEKINIYNLFLLFLFNKKMALQELTLNWENNYEDESERQNFLQQIQSWTIPLTLSKLHLFCNDSSSVEPQIIIDIVNQVVTNPFLMVSDLAIRQFQLTNHLEDIQRKLSTPEHLSVFTQLKILEISQSSFKPQNWELFFDIFVFAPNIFLEKLSLKSFINKDEDMIVGLCKSSQKKQQLFQQRQRILQSLCLVNCLLDHRILLVFLVNAFCCIEQLKIIGCKGFDETVRQLKKFAEANPDIFKQFTYKLKEINISNLSEQIRDDKDFTWFFRDFIFNNKSQQITSLKLCSNSENSCIESQRMNILSNIIKEVKSYGKKNGQPTFYRLREIDFSGNKLIDKDAWLNLFNGMLDHDLRGDKNDEKPVVKNQQIQSSELKDIEMKILMVQKGIPEKIKQNKIPIRFPDQLTKLHLQFDEVSQQQKENIKKLVFGFLGSPLCNVTELRLERVEILFFASQFLEKVNIYKRETGEGNKQEKLLQNLETLIFCSPQVELIYGKVYDMNQDTKSWSQLIFLCFNYLNLKFLQLDWEISSRHTHYIYDGLLKEIPQIKQSRLQHLRILNMSVSITISDSLKFFKLLIFNKFIPLQHVYFQGFGNDIKIKTDQNFVEQLRKHCSEYLVPLKSFTFLIEKQKKDNKDNPDLEETLTQLLQVIMDGKYVKLDKLYICMEDNQLFKNIVPEILEAFTITDLRLLFLIKLTPEHLKFFFKIRPQLTNLMLGKLDLLDQQMTLPQESSQHQQYQTCNFEIITTSDDWYKCQETIFKAFYQGNLFGWDTIRIQQMLQFEFKDPNWSKNIRVLCLQGDLSRQGMGVLANDLIFDQESMLEELRLSMIDRAGCEIFQTCAKKFLESSQISKQTTCLRLKRLTINRSKYLQQENFITLSQNLLFFPLITLQQLSLEDFNLTDDMSIELCNNAQQWIKYQIDNQRTHKQIQLTTLNYSKNPVVESLKACKLFFETFLFSDSCPSLREVNLSSMNLSDQIISALCTKSVSYMSSKAQTYIHPLKKIIFQKNSALSTESWKKLFLDYFLNDKIQLDTLDMNFTPLNQESVEAIYSIFKNKAQYRFNQLLSISQFYCMNGELKQMIQRYLGQTSFQIPTHIALFEKQDVLASEKYEDLAEMPQNEPGNIGEWPPSMGDSVSLITKTFRDYKSVKFNLVGGIPFPIQFHINIVQGFLIPVNNIISQFSHFNNTLFIDVNTCDHLASMYSYNDKVGKPYPYQLLFQESARMHYNEECCKINKIIFISSNTKNQEFIDQFDVYKIWSQMKETKIDCVILNYELNDDLVELMIQIGYTEQDIVNLVRMFPPTSVQLQLLSLSALKVIYSIIWDNHNFEKSTIFFNQNSFINVGLGYAAREILYKSKANNIISRLLKRIGYSLFDLFVSDTEHQQFDEQTKVLDQFLRAKPNFRLILALSPVLWIIVAALGPLFWQIIIMSGESQEQVCQDGITIGATYTYAVFAVFSLLTETYLYKKIVDVIPDHVKPLIQVKEDVPQNQIKPIIDLSPQYVDEEQQDMLIKSDELPKQNQHIKQGLISKMKHYLAVFGQSKQGKALVTSKNIILSQLDKYDLFNDVCFLMTLYYCNINQLALPALIILILKMISILSDLLKNIASLFSKNIQLRQLNTSYITEFSQISNAGGNMALSTILDEASPYNIYIIPNNKFTRQFIPDLAGKSMSNSVKGFFIKFWIEDTPQSIISMIYVIMRNSNSASTPIQLYLTLITSLINLVTSFVRYMSIQPSVITQQDFDQLAAKQGQRSHEIRSKYLIMEKEMLDKLV